jgi:hypothetical protein
MAAFRQALGASLGLVLACGERSANVSGSGGAAGTFEGGSQASPEGGAGGASATLGGPSSAGDASGDVEAAAAGSPGASGAAAAGGQRSTCTGSEPLVTLSGEPLGLERCDDGLVHRVRAQECAVNLPTPTGIAAEAPGCHSNEDCTERRYGYCVRQSPASAAHCEYACALDADCPGGEICECGALLARCVPASCGTDEDCPLGELCGLSDDPGRCLDGPVDSFRQFLCTGPRDVCRTHDDCPMLRCGVTGDARVCLEAGICGIGRPFVVAGVARVAGPAARTDWLDAARPSITLKGDARLQAARYWQQAALLEHASVAAFSRFVLELLASGAPAALVNDAVAAARDEVRHAELCFGLASAYAGHAVGPGPLAVDGAVQATLRDAVLSCVAEGCIAETVAALEAAEAREHAEDPVVRDVLARIAEDEGRHAELAFRFVHWALEQDPELCAPVLDLVRLESARDAAAVPAHSAAEQRSLSLGIYPERLRSLLRDSVVREIVMPCLEAMAGGRAGAGGAKHPRQPVLPLAFCFIA